MVIIQVIICFVYLSIRTTINECLFCTNEWKMSGNGSVVRNFSGDKYHSVSTPCLNRSMYGILGITCNLLYIHAYM